MVRASILSGVALGLLVAVGVNVNVSNHPDLQEEIDVAVDPTNPDHLVAGSNSNNPTSGTPYARVYETTNAGATWSGTQLPFASGFTFSSDPALTFDRSGGDLVGLAVFGLRHDGPSLSRSRSDELSQRI